MTAAAPVWMAFAPEVHSASLSSGPGPGPLLAAAAAWNALSAEYDSAATELSAAMSSVQAGVWEGPSADSYVAANVPFVGWLTQAGADSAAAAAQHQAAAAAYSAALAAMPTLAELAANHAIHGVLVATNFFGINTIPIALNEADYARMWMQAAVTMTTYQTVAGAAVAAAPRTTAAPQIQKAAGATPAHAAAAQSAQPVSLQTVLAYLQQLGISKQTADAWGVDNIYNFLTNPVGYTQTHLIHRLLTDPLSLLVNPLYLFFDGDEAFFPLGYAFLPSVGALGLGAGASAGAFAGLAGVGAVDPAPAPAPAPVADAPTVSPVAGMPASVPASAAGTGTVPAPPPAHAAGTLAGSPPAPPAGAVANFVPPYAVGPPGIGFDSGVSASARASASAKNKAPEPDGVATAAAAAARHQARARRRRRATRHDHADEFADMNIDVDPDWDAPPDGEPLASGNGAGSVGFAGTVRTEAVEAAAGLATLGGDGFGSGPRVPMVPGSWAAERPHGDG